MKLNRFVSNSGWEIVQQLYISLISFLIGLIAARYLGPNYYGEISIASSIMLLITSVAWLGIDSIIINELVIAPEKEEEYVGTVLLTRIVLAAAILPLFFVGVKVIYHDTLSSLIFWLVGAAMLFQVHEIFHWWLQSRLMMKFYSLAMMVTATVVAAYQIVLLVNRMNVYWFASVQLLQSLLLFGILLWVYRMYFKKKLKCSKSVLKDLLSKSHHFIISSVAITLYMQIDKVMIGKMLSSAQAGCYTAAVNIGEVWRFVPLALIGAAKPILFEYKKEYEEKFDEYLKHMIFLISAVVIVICLGITAFASLIIKLSYGEDYMEAVLPLQLVTWATAFSILGVMRSIWIVAYNLNQYDKYFTVSAGILNIILNYFFIKWWGITGAALSTLVSYFFETVIVNFFFGETRRFNTILLQSVYDGKNAFEMLRSILKR